MARPSGPTLALLACLVACLVVAGCGSGAERAEDPAAEPSSASSAPGTSTPPSSAPSPSAASPSGAPAGSPEVVLVSASAARGETTDVAVPLADQAAVAAFAAQFDGSLAEEVTAAAAELGQPVGARLYGQVVAIGCDVPPQVSVEERAGTVVLRPLAVKSPHLECFVPVTTVALALVEG